MSDWAQETYDKLNHPHDFKETKTRKRLFMECQTHCDLKFSVERLPYWERRKLRKRLLKEYPGILLGDDF